MSLPGRIALRGPVRRGTVRSAALALNGASGTELGRAWSLADELAEERLLVAVDGGLDSCLAAGLRPALLVGDGDSVRGSVGEISRRDYARDKDFSDLSGALAELRRRDVGIVVVAGLLGGRLDHEWANLFELGRHARHFDALLAPADRGSVVVTSHGCGATTEPDRTVSLFCLGGAARVGLRGTRWELDDRPLRPGSLGLSNRTGGELDLVVHRGVVALVFLP